MATYAELQARIAALQAQAAQLREAERAQIIADVRAKIAEYGLTARDLGLTLKVVGSAKMKGNSPARYVGPHGELWSGLGRKPGWVHAALARGQALPDLAIRVTRVV